MTDDFNGFQEETLEFLRDLKENNDKVWFENNRDLYEQYILEPSRAFVISMGERLREISPDINADPRVNRSLFRINRDVRFSKDKSPYKTNLGILFWEGPGNRMECPGFYFHLQHDSLVLGGGMHTLPKNMLESFRNVVSDETSAMELSDIVGALENSGMEIGGLHYKRTPRGFSDDHPYSHFLKYKGLYCMETTGIPDELFSRDLIEYSFARFRTMNPLNQWFLRHLYEK